LLPHFRADFHAAAAVRRDGQRDLTAQRELVFKWVWILVTIRYAAVIRLVFAFLRRLWCIEGLTRPMAKRPCQRNSTLIEYGTDD
jgi:hypothetical protein